MSKNSLGKLNLTITRDYCHKEVIDLFYTFIQADNLKLFAITSDIDNLGEFIAYNGRARGQNLVDYYTNITAEFVFGRLETGEPQQIVFIPAGEEVSILGLCHSEIEFEKFIRDLNLFIKDKIRNAKIFTGLTGIKFGGKILDEDYIKDMIHHFVNIQNNPEYESFEEYYEILYEIRTAVTPHVDYEKFKTLGISEKQDIIFLRNVIYHELLGYKKNTKELLQNMAENKSTLDVAEELTKDYGLDEEKIKIVAEIKAKMLAESN